MRYLLGIFVWIIVLPGCHKHTINPDDQIRKVGYKLYAYDSLFTFYIPTGFTPNGDGINDYWQPVSNPNVIDSTHYSINILNKGGEILFSSTSPAKYYGLGKNGKILSQRTLSFHIEARDERLGEKHTFKGNFILFR